MDLQESLNNLELQISAKPKNQVVEQQNVSSEEFINREQVMQNSPNTMSEGQAKALLDTIKNPQDALGLQVAKEITNKVQYGAGKERLENTADKIIESGLTTLETDADNQMNKAQKTAEEVYYESKKVQLNRGGIKQQTSQKIMTRVVKTDDIWSDINFYLFTWWVIGINNYFSNMREFHWFFKAVINILFTLPLMCLIPFEFAIGVVACLGHFGIVAIKEIYTFVKGLVQKCKDKKVGK